ncbi:hypothetical protein YC2023_120147 [Brassica napus]
MGNVLKTLTEDPLSKQGSESLQRHRTEESNEQLQKGQGCKLMARMALFEHSTRAPSITNH